MQPLPRRAFLRASTLAAVLPLAARAQPAVDAAPDATATGGGIDTNVSLFRWPFRRLPLEDTARLVARLRSLGIRQAWAGSFEGILSKDLAAVNERLAAECRQHGGGMLVPFGEINPALPDWERDLQTVAGRLGMRGIRLHPNYHGYTLADPRCLRLLTLAGERGLLVQLAVSLEDERTQPPLARAPHVDVSLLPELLGKVPGVRVQLLNAFRSVRGQILLKLAATGRVFFEIAMLEGVGGVANLLRQLPSDRLLFGSHAPFFYPEAAHLKLLESELSDTQRAAILSGNAARLGSG